MFGVLNLVWCGNVPLTVEYTCQYRETWGGDIGLGISRGLAGIAKGMWNEIRKSREPCGNPGQPSHTRSR